MAQDDSQKHKINPTKEGYLDKQSSWFKTYRKRWMVLQGHSLYSFKQEKEYDKATEIFDLKIYNKVQTIQLNENKNKNITKYPFEILSANDKRLFIASSEKEMKEWIKCIINATNPPKPIAKASKIKNKKSPLMDEIDIAVRNRAISSQSKLKLNAKSDDKKEDIVYNQKNLYKHKQSSSQRQILSNSSKCNHFSCKCRKFVQNASKWNKGKCKTCNHTAMEHEHGYSANVSIVSDKKQNKIKQFEQEYSINYNFDEYVYTVAVKKCKYTIEDLRSAVMAETDRNKNELIFMLDGDVVTDYNMDIIQYFQFSNTDTITFDVALNINKVVIESKEEKNKEVDGNEGEDECVVCMDEERSYICTPCGHFCICEGCIEAISNKCPICRMDCKVIQVFK